jgi:hypothetical protein
MILLVIACFAVLFVAFRYKRRLYITCNCVDVTLFEIYIAPVQMTAIYTMH